MACPHTLTATARGQANAAAMKRTSSTFRRRGWANTTSLGHDAFSPCCQGQIYGFLPPDSEPAEPKDDTAQVKEFLLSAAANSLTKAFGGRKASCTCCPGPVSACKLSYPGPEKEEKKKSKRQSTKSSKNEPPKKKKKSKKKKKAETSDRNSAQLSHKACAMFLPECCAEAISCGRRAALNPFPDLRLGFKFAGLPRGLGPGGARGNGGRGLCPGTSKGPAGEALDCCCHGFADG